jgi:hypothetical protein
MSRSRRSTIDKDLGKAKEANRDDIKNEPYYAIPIMRSMSLMIISTLYQYFINKSCYGPIITVQTTKLGYI